MTEQIETFELNNSIEQARTAWVREDQPVAPARFAGRVGAFERLGTDVTAAADPNEVLAIAGLTGWNVHREQAYTTLIQDDGVETVPIPGKYAICRTSPTTGRQEPMGGVRSGYYEPVQNESLADLLRAVTDESGATPVAAGQLDGGNKVFVEMQLPGTMLVGGVDPVEKYIVAFNSHDGSSAVRLALTNRRLFCCNQQAAVLREAKSSFAIYHTKTAKAQIDEVRHVLELGWRYDAAFEAAAQRMVNEQIALDDFREVCREVFGAEEGDGADKGKQKNRWEKVDATLGIFQGAVNLENVRGTAWAGYQAIVEYLDHNSPVNGKRDADLVRATRVASGALDSVKVRAFDLLAV